MAPLVLGPAPAASCHRASSTHPGTGRWHSILAPLLSPPHQHPPACPQGGGLGAPPPCAGCPEPTGALQPGCDPLPGKLRIQSSPNLSFATSFFQRSREEGAMPKPTQQQLQAWEAPSHPAEAPMRPAHPCGMGCPCQAAPQGPPAAPARLADTHPFAQCSAGRSHPSNKWD